MCQSVPNRRGRAAAARCIASANDGASLSVKEARSQPSTFAAAAEEEKKPSQSFSSANNNSNDNAARPLTGNPAERQPTDAPPFTIGTLRKAIPPHCFERSLLRSSLSLALDLALAAALAAAATAGIPRIPAALSPLRALAWLAYWWFQGAVCTGIWVQAHECGHQAFSSSQAVNDSVGLVLHSLLLVRFFFFEGFSRVVCLLSFLSLFSLFFSLSFSSSLLYAANSSALHSRALGISCIFFLFLWMRVRFSLLGSLSFNFIFLKKNEKVPYFSWKHSHRRHHSNTGSVDRDEVFVPPVRRSRRGSSCGDCNDGGDSSEEKEEEGKVKKMTELANASLLSRALGSEQFLASAPGRLGAILFALTLGWPAYLCFNVSGRPTFPEGSWPNHFAPSSPIFTSRRERLEVAVNDAALAAVAAGLLFLGKSIGVGALLRLYFVPYLVVNAWLVTITRTTAPRAGTGCAGPSPPSTATTAASSTRPTTTSRTPTSSTTFSRRSRTTTPRRRRRPSSRSWESTTLGTRGEASSGRSGRTLGSAPWCPRMRARRRRTGRKHRFGSGGWWSEKREIFVDFVFVVAVFVFLFSSPPPHPTPPPATLPHTYRHPSTHAPRHAQSRFKQNTTLFIHSY